MSWFKKDVRVYKLGDFLKVKKFNKNTRNQNPVKNYLKQSTSTTKFLHKRSRIFTPKKYPLTRNNHHQILRSPLSQSTRTLAQDNNKSSAKPLLTKTGKTLCQTMLSNLARAHNLNSSTSKGNYKPSYLH